MGENGEAASGAFSEFKEFWKEKFSFLNDYARFTRERLPTWSTSDVEEFIASDPVHGPTLITTRKAANFGIVGGVIGAVSTAGFAWKYSKSPHGAALALGAGAVFGGTFGLEAGSHWYQTYRLDTLTPQYKFLEWWEKKNKSWTDDGLDKTTVCDGDGDE